MDEDGPAPLGLAQRLSDMHDRILAAGQDRPRADAALLLQLHSLAAFVEAARLEVAAVGAEDIVGRQVPAAKGEIDAVALHTAEATGVILDACEALEAAAHESALDGVVSRSTARIYEACSFQDITGQRLKKVVQVLRTIEARVGDMVHLFGSGPSLTPIVQQGGMLLNGPQGRETAMNQGDVDALLASFE